ncbi:helix-turn-helix transcriptional regulator [Corynebacterium casei]|uniref:helix-turn-helix transcriptional regulator n=1 Tax=Corynebacterium casei TaxID=160386 RepID=UPI003FB8600A
MFTTENIEHLAEVLRTAGELHVEGPTASRKTMLSEELAKSLGLPRVVEVGLRAGLPSGTPRSLREKVKRRAGTSFTHIVDRGDVEDQSKLPERVPGELRIVASYGATSALPAVPTVRLEPPADRGQTRISGSLHLPSGEVLRLPVEAEPRTPSELLTIDELATQLGVTPLTVDRWRRQGSGPAFVQVGRGIRYLASDVDAWIAANRTDPAA